MNPETSEPTNLTKINAFFASHASSRTISAHALGDGCLVLNLYQQKDDAMDRVKLKFVSEPLFKARVADD